MNARLVPIVSLALAACLLAGCAAARPTLRAAQLALSGVVVTVDAQGAALARVSPRYVCALPTAHASLSLDLPVLGRAWSLDTERHPGPWYYRVDVSEDESGRWVQLVSVRASEIVEHWPDLAGRLPMQLAATPTSPSSPRLPYPR